MLQLRCALPPLSLPAAPARLPALLAPDCWLSSPACCSAQRFKFKHNLYKLREERDIKPSAFGQLVSATLYERRFGPYFCQPVIGAPRGSDRGVAAAAGGCPLQLPTLQSPRRGSHVACPAARWRTAP